MFARNDGIPAANQGLNGITIGFKVSMRAAPTATVVGSWSGNQISAINAYAPTTEYVTIQGVSNAAGTCYYYAGSSSVGVTLDAEL